MSESTNARAKAERRRRKVIAMFADPTNAPTIQDAAKLLGVSAKTIARDLQNVSVDVAEATSKLEEYQRRLKKRLPIEKRVQLLAEIAEQKENLFARFKALQRADALDGVITEAERLKARTSDEPTPSRPMFVFAGGLSIDFGSGSLADAPIRNITPGIDTDSSDTD